MSPVTALKSILQHTESCTTDDFYPSTDEQRAALGLVGGLDHTGSDRADTAPLGIGAAMLFAYRRAAAKFIIASP